MQNPMMIQFNQFMQQMKGQDPQKVLEQLVKSGKVSQKQLNDAQKKAQAIGSQLESLRRNYGF
jgi:hypothetical protein